jgi:hypothetical protein
MEFPTRIVSDSLSRIRRSKEYAATKARLMTEARERHSKETRAAHFWGQIWLRVVIEREVRAQLAKMFPPSGLYVVRRER